MQARIDANHGTLLELVQKVREASTKGETDVQALIREYRDKGGANGARIMADNDVQGQFTDLLRVLTSALWKQLFTDLSIVVETFDSLGLSRKAEDGVVWQRCQDEGVVLFTGNRNGDGPNSLENIIRQHNKPDCLPVITLGDAQRFTRDRAYAEAGGRTAA